MYTETYEDLWQWSVDEYKHFWREVWIFCTIQYSSKFTSVVDSSKRITEVPKWFQGARLNYAENLLRYRDERVAVVSAGLLITAHGV